MTSVSVLDGFLYAAALAALSAMLTRVMLNANILAVPNHRSSHPRPVPNSGGVAIVATAYLGVSAAYAVGPYFEEVEQQLIGLGLAAFIIVIAGLSDDLGRFRSFGAKLAAQLLACGVLLAFDVVITVMPVPFFGAVRLGGWGYPVTAIWIIGITNIYNFMDGLDGLAAGTAIIAAAGFGLICVGQGASFSVVLCLVLAAATLGLLFFNFPKARIFMGDVGSQFLGFALAALAVLAAEFEQAGITILLMPLLLFNFIFDTVFTFCRRFLAGQNVTQAHRSHLYQLMNQLGHSHARVSMFHFVVALLQAGGAVALVKNFVVDPALIFLPFLVFQSAYAALVLRATRRRRSA